jgi:hypothetical protein
MGSANPGVMLEFSSAVQSLGALQGAAYRLVGTATCQIDQVADRFVCQLRKLVTITATSVVGGVV